MSTLADCHIQEYEPGKWRYKLQRYPYGDNEDYDTFDGFNSYEAATDHLSRNHANPGGFSVQALPGCKHDRVRLFDKPNPYNEEQAGFCPQCGHNPTFKELGLPEPLLDLPSPNDEHRISVKGGTLRISAAGIRVMKYAGHIKQDLHATISAQDFTDDATEALYALSILLDKGIKGFDQRRGGT